MKSLTIFYETIECIEDTEILEISKGDLDGLLASSESLTKVYHTILEKYAAVNSPLS